MTSPIAPRQRIAVIGAGVSGLVAAWLLRQQHHVTVFEADSRLGGHANTVDVTIDGVHHPVDTGFLVFNDWTYPNLIGMFNHLGIVDAPSDMSFSVSLGGGAFEWAGSDALATTFAQPSNVLKPAFWSMIFDLLRFNREASALVDSGAPMVGSLGNYLDTNGYGRAFRHRYLVPMAACIWSTPAKTIHEFPLATFLTFCRNHGLISVNNRPKWRTVKNGSRQYVVRLAQDLADVRLNCPVQQIERHANAVTIVTPHGRFEFDQVVLACHTDQALAMLESPSDAERSMLGGIRYQPNQAILHTDATLMPTRRRAWAAWNFMAKGEDEGEQPVSLTYYLNRLQPLPFKSPVLVTMNPLYEPAADKVIQRFDYSHPVYTADSVTTQAALRQLQGLQRTWYCGAWTRFGFHEDGVISGMAVAKALGASIPWQPHHGATQPKAVRAHNEAAVA